VKGLFKGLFSPGKAATPAPPEDPQERIAWRKARMFAWQAAWHDHFDRDKTLMALGEFDRPKSIRDDIDSDYRLIFGISRAEKATRDACFDQFPQGAEMAARFDAYLTKKPVQMTQAEAREGLEELAPLLTAAGPSEEIDYAHVEIVDRDTKEGLQALGQTDDVTIVLEASEFEQRTYTDLASNTARSFLTEPLYASAGNYYQLRDWVTSAMYGRESDAIYGVLYRMWAGGWQVALGESSVILAKRHVGPKAG
jgi:hypothetical protein